MKFICFTKNFKRSGQEFSRIRIRPPKRPTVLGRPGEKRPWQGWGFTFRDYCPSSPWPQTSQGMGWAWCNANFQRAALIVGDA